VTPLILRILQLLDQIGGLNNPLVGRTLRSLTDVFIEVEITPHLVCHASHEAELRNQEDCLVRTFVNMFQQELILVFYSYIPLFLVVVHVRSFFISFLDFKFVLHRYVENYVVHSVHFLIVRCHHDRIYHFVTHSFSVHVL